MSNDIYNYEGFYETDFEPDGDMDDQVTNNSSGDVILKVKGHDEEIIVSADDFILEEDERTLSECGELIIGQIRKAYIQEFGVILSVAVNIIGRFSETCSVEVEEGNAIITGDDIQFAI